MQLYEDHGDKVLLLAGLASVQAFSRQDVSCKALGRLCAVADSCDGTQFAHFLMMPNGALAQVSFHIVLTYGWANKHTSCHCAGFLVQHMTGLFFFLQPGIAWGLHGTNRSPRVMFTLKTPPISNPFHYILHTCKLPAISPKAAKLSPDVGFFLRLSEHFFVNSVFKYAGLQSIC